MKLYRCPASASKMYLEEFPKLRKGARASVGGGDRNALVRRVCGHVHQPAGFCRFAL
jgi:hypothetical protein